MDLKVLERIVLLGLLPQEASYLNFKIVTNLKSELSFSEEEQKELNMVEKEGMVTWDSEKEKEKYITIGEKATDLIIAELKKLDKDGKINSQNSSLYERFVLGK